MKLPRSVALSLSGVGLCFALLCGVSCVSVKTEHKIEPIHITMDVNVRLERELADAFSDLDARSREIAIANEQQKGTGQ